MNALNKLGSAFSRMDKEFNEFTSPPQSLPSGASFVKALLSLRPIGDHINAALVYYGDAAQGSGHLVHDLGIGVAVGLHVRPLEDGLAEAAELHGVGSEDGLGVTTDQAR